MKNWIPHFDFHNERLWPPGDHPLHCLFHDARLKVANGEWNYKKALEYAESVRGDKNENKAAP